jgi:hypothetical protein
MRSYSQEEWQNLTSAYKQEIYRQQESLATARTVVAEINETLTASQTDDVSAITTNTQNNMSYSSQSQNANGTANGNNRALAQVTLDNISQALTCRRTAGVYTTMSKGTMIRRTMDKMSQKQIKTGRAELDSHADTCGVNDVARILAYTDQVAEVSGFANSLDSLKNILYFGKQLDEILLNSNQIRANGNIVDYVPKSFGGEKHSISFSTDGFTLPLKLRGITSYFPIRTPTVYEIENCTMYSLT